MTLQNVWFGETCIAIVRCNNSMFIANNVENFEEPISTKEDAFNIRNTFYFTLCVSERAHVRGGIEDAYPCVCVVLQIQHM